MEIGRIHSRELFLYLLDKELKRARRHNYSFCTLKLTLSQLPNNENDKGLQTCFQRLIHFAEEEFRESDILGFLGEHQLAVILPYTDPNTVTHAQSRLKERLKYYGFKKEGCEVKIDRICFPTDGSKTTDLIEQLREKKKSQYIPKKSFSIFPPPK
jgi:PleD family two-component response regulator